MIPVVPATFHSRVLADPLFAAEGMDLKNAACALDALVEVLAHLEVEYARGSFFRRLFFVRYPLARYAVPLSFLRTFVRAEEMRRAYLASPSYASARRLIAVWHETAKQYETCAMRYRTLHRILVRLESSEREFVMQDMFGRLSSYSYIERSLAALVENGRALRRTAQLFGQLLDGKQVEFSKPSCARALPPLPSGEMLPWQSAIHEMEIKHGVSPFRQSGIVEKLGPFRYTLANFDETPKEHLFMCYICRDKTRGLNTLWFAQVDSFIFQDLWRPGEGDDAIVRGTYAASVGIAREEMPYWYEPSTHLYNTRDLHYWADMATRVDLVRRPHLDRALVSCERSSLFDMILGECVRDMRTMVSHLKRRARSNTSKSYSALYDLLTRSFPSVYYLPSNGSVWRLKERLRLIGDGYEVPRAANILSGSEIRERLSPDILSIVMKVQKLREDRGKAAGWL
jgi:hypothetical protein